MEIKDLKGWLVHGLQDLYSAENQVLEALPKMADAASNDELKKAFKEHKKQTQEHVSRLEKALDALGKKPDTSVKCKGMEGLIKEGEELLKKKDKIAQEVLDVALIEAAQKVEHYEIGSYGSAVTYAELLGEEEVAQILEDTLGEEESTDAHLTQLAKDGINKKAMSSN